MHKLTETEGEKICIKCGRVMGYVEEASYQDHQSHNIGMFGFSELYNIASKIGKNLNLPQFAIHTIVKTASKISQHRITKKQAILFATIYSCRIHNIPKLLGDIFFEFENQCGTNTQKSEKSLLRALNKISKNIMDSEIFLSPPNREYYLQAYLAKIQPHIISETNLSYFEILRYRATRMRIKNTDPSSAAREAILQSLTSVLRLKMKGKI
jgi:hypothetical protein